MVYFGGKSPELNLETRTTTFIQEKCGTPSEKLFQVKNLVRLFEETLVEFYSVSSRKGLVPRSETTKKIVGHVALATFL